MWRARTPARAGRAFVNEFDVKVLFLKKSKKFGGLCGARAGARTPNFFLARAPMPNLLRKKNLARARPRARFCENFQVGTPPLRKKHDFLKF